MSLLHIDPRAVEDLAPLKAATPEVAVEVARISVAVATATEGNSLRDSLESAAKGLGVELSSARVASLALARVLTDGVRSLVTESDFRASLTELVSLSEPVASGIAKTLEENREELLDAASRAGSAMLEYVDMNWRLDVEIASRHREDEVPIPSYILRLDTRPGLGSSARGKSQTDSLYLKSDHATLARALEAVDEATTELTSGHASRVTRYMRH